MNGFSKCVDTLSAVTVNEVKGLFLIGDGQFYKWSVLQIPSIKSMQWNHIRAIMKELYSLQWNIIKKVMTCYVLHHHWLACQGFLLFVSFSWTHHATSPPHWGWRVPESSSETVSPHTASQASSRLWTRSPTAASAQQEDDHSFQSHYQTFNDLAQA